MVYLPVPSWSVHRSSSLVLSSCSRKNTGSALSVTLVCVPSEQTSAFFSLYYCKRVKSYKRQEKSLKVRPQPTSELVRKNIGKKIFFFPCCIYVYGCSPFLFFFYLLHFLFSFFPFLCTSICATEMYCTCTKLLGAFLNIFSSFPFMVYYLSYQLMPLSKCS